MTDPLKNANHWDGAEYCKIAFPQHSINRGFLSEHPFGNHEVVLDIGCGDGTTTREIGLMVPSGQVLGIDASSKMIDFAKAIPHEKNTHFELLNAQKISFFEKFDVSTCFFCMQWVPDKIQTFRHISQALKTKGRFLMIVPLPHPHLPSIRAMLIGQKKWQQYFENYQDPLVYINDFHYEQYAENAGMQISSFRVDPTPIQFPDYASFFGFMSQMTPHLEQLESLDQKHLFIEELIVEYSKIYPPTQQGGYTLTYHLVKLCAVK